MTGLDPDRILCALDAMPGSSGAQVEVFREIESTNTYLMRQASPEAGRCRVAVTDNQTAGRGRHGKSWQSPPGSGLCLSMAYTFGQNPENLPALTLAIGVGVIEGLAAEGIAGVQIKWPNDLIAGDGKLGGILTEAQTGVQGAVTVVSGLGLNINLGDGLVLEDLDEGALRAVDLKGHAGQVPQTEDLAAVLIHGLENTFITFEQRGFREFAGRWADYDWLLGREMSVANAGRELSGTGAGISDDGALLLSTRDAGTQRVTSGTVFPKQSRTIRL